MKRSLRLAGVIVVVVLGCARPAQANLWDVLEELSGPGPFHTRAPYNLMLNLICTDTKKRLFTFPEADPAKQPTCLFYDERFLRADADTRFGRVDVLMIETGPYVRLHRTFEVGAGIGFIRFSSTRADGTKLTPIQVTV